MINASINIRSSSTKKIKNSHQKTSAHTRILPALTSIGRKGKFSGVLFSELLSLERGYFKVWRKIKDHPIMQMPNCLHLFIYLMTEVEWQEGRKKFFNGVQITLKSGQLTCGRKQISMATRLSERQIRTAFHNLEKLEIVTIQPTNRMSLVTIINWDTYQNQELKTTSRRSNDRPATDQQPTTPVSLKHLSIKKNTLSSTSKRTKKCYDETCGIEVPEKDFNRHMTSHRV